MVSAASDGHRALPTGVGVNRVRCAGRRRGGRAPHRRGGEPIDLTSKIGDLGRSPQAWG